MKRFIYLILFLIISVFTANAQLNSARLMVFIDLNENGQDVDPALYELKLSTLVESDSWNLINQQIIRDKWNTDRDLMSFASYSKYNAAADIIYRFSIDIKSSSALNGKERINADLVVSSVLLPYKMKEYRKTYSAESGLVDSDDVGKELDNLVETMLAKSADKLKKEISEYMKSEINDNNFLFIFRNIAVSGKKSDLSSVLKKTDIKSSSMNVVDGNIFVNVEIPASMETVFSKLMQNLRDYYPDIIMRHQTGSLMVFDLIY